MRFSPEPVSAINLNNAIVQEGLWIKNPRKLKKKKKIVGVEMLVSVHLSPRKRTFAIFMGIVRDVSNDTKTAVHIRHFV